jgi:hypothetical protein
MGWPGFWPGALADVAEHEAAAVLLGAVGDDLFHALGQREGVPDIALGVDRGSAALEVDLRP